MTPTPRQVQDQALLDAAFKHLDERYGDRLRLPVGDPAFHGDEDSPPSVLRELRADAVAAIRAISTYHVAMSKRLCQDAIPAPGLASCATAWAYDGAQLDIALKLLSDVNLT